MEKNKKEEEKVRIPVDIFELLKEIKEAKTNQELIGYFRFTKFYGLLDPKNKNLLDEIEFKNQRSTLSLSIGYLTTLSFGYYFYKKNFHKIAMSGLLGGALPLCFIFYKNQNEINFTLLEMKEDYIFKINRFFLENKNPTLLNPNFLVEDLVDPELQNYQKFLRNKATNI